MYMHMGKMGKYSMLLMLAFCSLLITVTEAYGDVQIDAAGGYMLVQDRLPPGEFNSLANNTAVDALFIHHRNKEISLLARDRFYGPLTLPVLPEWIVPTSNRAELGILYEGDGMAYAGFRNVYYGYVKTIAPDWVPLGSVIRQNWLSDVQAHWHLPVGPVDILADALYSWLDYRFIDPEGINTDERDTDLWVSGGLRAHLPQGLVVGAGSRVKTDLNGYQGYDYNESEAYAGGTHVLMRKRIYLTWRTSGFFRKSEAMYLRGYADGFGAGLYAHPVLKIKTNLFLKAIVNIETGDEMFKQRYDLIFRKTWKSGSAIDIGYWNTAGVLFPRQGIYGKATTVIGIVSLSAGSHVFSRQPSETGRFWDEYYRSLTTAEVMVRPIKRMELYLRGGIDDFAHYPPFTNRLSLSGGIRLW
jgi:hypothetical protein